MSVAFAAFSICASGVYLLNDLMDSEYDRVHPEKRNRPIVSGLIEMRFAILLLCILFGLAIALSSVVSTGFLAFVLLYVALNSLYSWQIKKVAPLDVFLVAGFYEIRLLAGSTVAGVNLPAEIHVFSYLLFLSFVLLKRFQDLEILARNEDVPVWRGYSLKNRDSLLTWARVCAGLTMFGAVRFNVVFGTIYSLWIGYYCVSARNGRAKGDPVTRFFSEGPTPLMLAGLGFAGWTFLLWSRFNIDLYAPGATDVYFDADLPRVYWNLFVGDQQIRSEPHPLFATLVVLPVRAIAYLAGLKPLEFLPLVLSGTATAFGALFFLNLRSWGYSVAESLVLTSLCAASAAAVAFFPITETYSFGSISVLLCFFLVSGERERHPAFAVACFVLSYAITLTNVAVAIFAILTGYSNWKKRLQIFVFGSLVAGALTIFQFGSLSPLKFESESLSEDVRFIQAPDLSRAGYVLRTVFLDTAVMPLPKAGRLANERERTNVDAAVTLYDSRFGGDPISVAALISWTVLLVLGIYSICSNPSKKRQRRFLFLVLAYYAIIHLIYGNEIFLFSLHWLPALVLICSFALRLRNKTLMTAAAAVATIVIGIHNYRQTSTALNVVQIPQAPLNSEYPFDIELFDLEEGANPRKTKLNISRLEQDGFVFDASIGSMKRPALLIKSNSSSPINALVWDKFYLYVNYRWSISIPNPTKAFFGDENSAPVLQQMKTCTPFEPPNRFSSGAGYAVIELKPEGKLEGCITDSLSPHVNVLTKDFCRLD
ncbi:MAG: UbiA family prenyltransferase [Bdellovibrionia bacterium]